MQLMAASEDETGAFRRDARTVLHFLVATAVITVVFGFATTAVSEGTIYGRASLEAIAVSLVISPMIAIVLAPIAFAYSKLRQHFHMLAIPLVASLTTAYFTAILLVLVWYFYQPALSEPVPIGPDFPGLVPGIALAIALVTLMLEVLYRLAPPAAVSAAVSQRRELLGHDAGGLFYGESFSRLASHLAIAYLVAVAVGATVFAVYSELALPHILGFPQFYLGWPGEELRSFPWVYGVARRALTYFVIALPCSLPFTLVSILALRRALPFTRISIACLGALCPAATIGTFELIRGGLLIWPAKDMLVFFALAAPAGIVGALSFGALGFGDCLKRRSA